MQALSRVWCREITPHKYAYNFSWIGRPIIQFPQDMIAMQEIIWEVKPDLIIETGIAHGGSILYYASIMELMGHEKSWASTSISARTTARRSRPTRCPSA